VCQQQVARHARVLMRLGAPLVALVVHVCLQVGRGSVSWRKRRRLACNCAQQL